MTEQIVADMEGADRVAPAWIAPRARRAHGDGRAAGRTLIRSHRLWETHLAKQLGLPADHLHATSEHLEHVTTPDMQADLAERAEHPRRDPHGREIP